MWLIVSSYLSLYMNPLLLTPPLTINHIKIVTEKLCLSNFSFQTCMKKAISKPLKLISKSAKESQKLLD